MAIKIPEGTVDKKDVVFGVCTHPAGHCYGSDGGSGIPANLKVLPGQGGSKEVWELSTNKSAILSKAVYNKCQYCCKYDDNPQPTQDEKEII